VGLVWEGVLLWQRMELVASADIVTACLVVDEVLSYQVVLGQF
jgi:hypothetical protein